MTPQPRTAAGQPFLGMPFDFTTEAGRELHARSHAGERDGCPLLRGETYCRPHSRIRRIEAEAAGSDGLRAALERLVEEHDKATANRADIRSPWVYMEPGALNEARAALSTDQSSALGDQRLIDALYQVHGIEDRTVTIEDIAEQARAALAPEREAGE